MSLKAPKRLTIGVHIDLSQERSEWLGVYVNYFTAAKVGKKEASVQTANFLAIIRRDALKIVNNLGLTLEEKKDLSTINTKLTDHFVPFCTKTKLMKGASSFALNNRKSSPSKNFCKKFKRK